MNDGRAVSLLQARPGAWLRARSVLVALTSCGAAACAVDSLTPPFASGADTSPGDAAGPSPSAPPEGAMDSGASAVDAAHTSVDAPAPPCNAGAPFGTPSPVNTLNSTFLSIGAVLSADELTVFFTSNRRGAGSNVFTAARPTPGAPFGSVAPVASLDFAGADTWNLTLTGDGLTAYLVTDQGGADHMYTATRASSLASFGAPTLMPAPIVAGEQPFVVPDGSVLYYSDDGTTPWSIARAVLGAQPAVSPVDLAVPPHDVGIPVINAAQTLMYFAVFDHDSVDSYDVWVAARATASDPWSAPTAVAEVNTPSFDAPSWLSPDGCTLYLTHGTSVAAGAAMDIYSATKP